LTAVHEIHPVSRPIVDPHFQHSFPDGLHIAGIADRQATNSGIDPRPRPAVTQTRQPTREALRLLDFGHDMMYPMEYKISSGAVLPAITVMGVDGARIGISVRRVPTKVGI